MLSNIKNLPKNIIYNILSYDDHIKYRNGKYIFQIPKTDERYKMLSDLIKNTQIITYDNWKIIRVYKPKYYKFPFYRFKIWIQEDKVYYCYFINTVYIRD